jgi:hypothetical protein
MGFVIDRKTRFGKKPSGGDKLLPYKGEKDFWISGMGIVSEPVSFV